MKNKFLLSFAGIYLLYCFLLTFIVPIFVKPLIPEQAKNFINGSVELESLAINPLSNKVSLKKLKLKNSEGLLLASFDELSVNIDLLPFILLNAHIDSLEINNLQLFTKDSDKPWLSLPELLVSKTSVAITQQEVDIEQIRLNKLLLLPVLNVDQSTNLDVFLAEIDKLLIKEEEEETLNEETETTPWLVHVAEFKLQDAKITLLDKMHSSEHYPDGISTTIHPINLNLASIHSDLSQDVSINLKAELLKGKLDIKGKLKPDTLDGKFNYQINELQLSELNPYVQHYSFASFLGGVFSTQGEIESQQQESEITEKTVDKNTESLERTPKEKQLAVMVKNSSSITHLEIKHQSFETSLVNCASIESSNLDFSLLDFSLVLDKVSITECHINPYIDKTSAGNFNLAKTLATKATPEQKDSSQQDSTQQANETTSNTTQKDLSINIKLVELINNTVNVEDFSQGERVNILIENIEAKVDNISAGSPNLSKFQLNALLNKHSPLTVEGNGNFINPKLSTKGTVTLKNFGLKEFSPYSSNVSSRPIDKGVLALDINIDVQENKLDSLASIGLLGLELGKKQEREGASKLPIGLALGILKDGKGNIHFDVPVKGDLDDPSFSVSKQVIKTLTGIITKAATAPLSIVGGLVTGGDNTKALHISFSAAQVVLNAQQEKNIQKTSDVLKKRPELSIRLIATLSATEALTVGDSGAQQALLIQRQSAVTNTLLNSGVDALQIEQAAIDSSSSSENSEVKLEFFAR